jgi:hypothetical protein
MLESGHWSCQCGAVYRRPAVLESTRTIDIDEFVQREEIDPRYIICSYYLVPMARLA